MNGLDAELLRQSLGDEATSILEKLDVFGSVTSTNAYLLGEPPPMAGKISIAIADTQTEGRGRHARRWLSPSGSGVYLSLAYTFAKQPLQLSVLTLALGVAIVRAMKDLDVDGVSLKWPNDIVALDGKLGGVLTEVQAQTGNGVTVVTGIGLNIDLSEQSDFGTSSDWAHRAVDLKSIVSAYPAREVIAASLIGALCVSIATFEERGFAGFAADWQRHDWLHGRHIIVDMPDRQVTGIAAGIDADGALLVDTGKEQTRVISGSIIMAESTEGRQ